MDSFAQMDIFFVVTTVVVVANGILVALVLFRVWRILGYVERISHEISEESALLRMDVAHLRANIQQEGFKLTHFMRFFLGAVGRFGRRKKSDS